MTGRPPAPEHRSGDGLAAALEATFAWFETNSGWAPPDPHTLEDWLAEGVCRSPDDCWVGTEGWCEHGLASWQLVLAVVDGDTWRPR